MWRSWRDSNADGVGGIAIDAFGGISPTGTAGGAGLRASAGSTVGTGNTRTGIGLHGISQTGPGVRGSTVTDSGVWGTAATGLGVLGQSSSGAGVFGDSTDPGGYGVFGRSTNGAAIFGTTTNGVAGSFNGPVFVQGAFTVVGGPKSAAVPHPDGSHRRMYCQESPEPWFGDVGRGKLVNGSATVKLDPDFAAVVRGDDYHVFLTEYGDHNALFVEGQTPSGFTVRAKDAPKAGSTFSYRVMARRKDIAGPRMERVILHKPSPSLRLPKSPDTHDPKDRPEPPRLLPTGAGD